MVLKFCSPPWTEGPAAVRTSNHELAEDYAPAGRRRSVAERAWDELLDSAPREEGELRLWEKEFCVFFDDSKPVGVGFQPVAAASSSSSNSFDMVQADSYVCAVREVAPVGLAADYNARCRANSDYSRVIVEKLRVRMVNGHDVAQVPYADVLQMMRDAKPALTLTLADVSSGLTSSSLGERSKSLSSVVWTRHTRRRSSLSTGPGKTQPRRNSYTGLDIKTDGLQLPETTTAVTDGSEALVNDLKAQHLEVSQQLSEARQQLSAKNREHEEAVAREQNEAAKQLESLLLESRKLQRERDDMIAVNKLLLRHKRASATTQAELEAVRTEQLQLQRRQEELEQALQDLQTQLAEQTLVTEESQALAAQLRHDKEVLTLQWQELQEEHRDTQSHVNELHDRLVDAQRAHRAFENMLTALRATHAAQTQQLQELQEAAEVAKLRVDAASQAEEESAPSVGQTAAVLPSESELLSLPQASIEPIIATLAVQQRLKDERFEAEQRRDELLAELLCQEQQLQQLQEQVRALELVNTTSKRLLASLHEELREAQTRERNMRVEFSVELEVVRKSAVQEAQAVQDALQRQVRELEQRCESECTEKQRLQLALDTLENTARSRVAANAKEQDFLVQFKRQLESGVVVTKFGARGVPHQRVVYSDPQCHWLSWRPLPTSSHGSLAHPRTDAKADTCDLVEVLAGATTETFARQRPDAPTRCFSLVFVHPCRTLDLQADTAAQCQQYLRGFRLLQEEAALKRR